MSAPFKFGKGVLNSLTTGMYSNELFIYREYVQNAADAIDEAVKSGMAAPEDGYQIHLDIDAGNRTITIEDNATGVQSSKAQALLGNVGASEKDSAENKGFRGIGRMGGLGYCSKLRMETSFAGEDVKTVSVWDAEKLRNMLRDKTVTDDASEVLRKTVEFSVERCEKSKHYFRVSLIDVSAGHNDLLDDGIVRKYLRMVAPVPFDFSRFPFVRNIKEFLKREGLPAMSEYDVFLNTQKLTKGYECEMSLGSSGSTVLIKDINTGILKDEGGIKGWYWFGVTDFDGTMKQHWQAGLRLRKENIQIGERDCLRKERLWGRETRFQLYFFGEVHALDKELIPNGRRDYFEEDASCRKFESLLREVFADLRDVAYTASYIRRTAKAVEAKVSHAEMLKDKITKGNFLTEESRDKTICEFEKTVGTEIPKAKKKRDKEIEKAKKKSEVYASSGIGRVFVSLAADAIREEDGLPDITATTPKEISLVPVKKLPTDVQRIIGILKSVLDSKLPKEEAERILQEVVEKISDRQ